ncbi:MAG: DUF4330 family protein [Oscillospiraceae bacterium]|nr:DUF4330 family protein [Oscillospiraceae bacterium]
MDKNGKIGGKVNIIDILILIVVIAVVVFVAKRFLLGDRTGVINNQPISMEFIANEVKDYVLDDIEVGARVFDNSENTELGTITGFELGQAYDFEVAASGETVRKYPDDSHSLTLTCQGYGNLDGNGAVIDGVRYAAGHTMVIYAGNAKVYVRISDIHALS